MAEILIGVKIEALEEGGYLATSDEVPGSIAQGRTVAETIEIAQTVPNHPGDLPRGTLRTIIREARLTVEEFLRGRSTV